MISSPRRFAYFYDGNSLARVDTFGKKGKRVGTLRFKDGKTKNNGVTNHQN